MNNVIKATLVKIDRNGSKHFEGLVKCDHCSGTGRFGWYGVCFKCNGAGKVFDKWIERTPEYEATLAARRREKIEIAQKMREIEIEKNKPAVRAKWLENNGFDENGITHVVLGNTYDIKEDLKAKGAKFCPTLGWHMKEELPIYQYIRVSVESAAVQNYDGSYTFREIPNFDEIKHKRYNELNNVVESEHVGEIGEKYFTKATLVDEKTYWTSYGYRGNSSEIHKYIFKDENNNILIWNSSKDNDLEKGAQYQICGTVKYHDEYRGEKQTVLSRCRIV